MDIYIVTSEDTKTVIEFNNQNDADIYVNSNGGEVSIVNREIFIEPPIQVLERTAEEYIEFGINLFTTIQKKVWAVNTLGAQNNAPLSTQQLLALLSQSDLLNKALSSGSLTTSKIILQQLTQGFPQYSSIGTFAINEINSYLGT